MNFFVEQLPNISTQQFQIHLSQKESNEFNDVDVSVDKAKFCSDSVDLISVEKNSTTTKTFVKFDCSLMKIDPLNCQLNKTSDTCWNLSIGAAENSRALLVPREKAAVFNVESLRNVCCRSCHSTIVDGANFAKVLPLPSTGWLELSELWNCRCSHSHPHKHNENNEKNENQEKKNSKKSGFAKLRAPIRAKIDTCLIGPSSLLVHALNVRENAVNVNCRETVVHGGFVFQNQSGDASLSALQCSQCDAIVGQALFNTEHQQRLRESDAPLSFSTLIANAHIQSDEDESFDIQFFPKALTNKAESKDFSIFSIETEIVADLEYHLQLNQVHRFFIYENGKENNLVLMLSILSNEWPVYFGDLNESLIDGVIDLNGKLQSYVKLLFLPIDESIESLIEEEKWRSRTMTTPVRSLVYTAQECRQLLSHLRQVNEALPSHLRRIDAFRVGGLPHLSL